MERVAYWSAVALILGLMAGIGFYNAREYPLYGGYDEVEHQGYTDLLIHHGRIPGRSESVQFDTPPGFYAVAGAGVLAGEQLGASDPWKVGRGLNVLWAVGSALLVLLTARLLFPGRRAVHLAALGFAAFLPVVLKVTAMLHPDPLNLFLATLALYLAVRLLVQKAFRPLPSIALGVVLGAGMLVRSFSVMTFLAVACTFALAALAGYARRREILVALGIATVATVVVASPWYVRQWVKYSNPLIFDRKAPDQPIWDRRPIAFYTGLGLPEVFTEPIRPQYVNNVWPTLYSDIWGDYFGNYAWGSPVPPSPDVDRQLTLQSELGVIPSALALAGWLALLVLSLRRSALRRQPALALVALLPLFGLIGYFGFVISYPSNDGDVLKATYALITVPGWALAFGFAVGAIVRGRLAQLAVAVFLVGCVVMNLGFLIFHSPLSGAF